MSSLFQTFVSGMKRSFTVISEGSSWGDTIRPPPEESSHRCFHMLIPDPSPILHRAPLQMTSLAFKILFQAKELRGLNSTSKMLLDGKYFGLNTLYSNVSFSWWSLHTCLLRSASLNCWRSRNHIPPETLESIRYSTSPTAFFLYYLGFPTKIYDHRLNILN